MATVAMFARDIFAFPYALFSSAPPAEVKEKARCFIRSTARVAFTAGIVWGLYKGQHFKPLRNLTVPAVVFSGTFARISFSLGLLSFLTYIYLIKTAKSKLALGGYISILTTFQIIPQTYHRWKTQPPIFFAASLKPVFMKIDPLTTLMTIALKIPEARLGIGLFLLSFGVQQVYSFTTKRWDLAEAPTDWALKGIFHVTFGAGWFMIYEKYSRNLEKDGRENTYFYKAADWLAPYLTLATTGQRG